MLWLLARSQCNLDATKSVKGGSCQRRVVSRWLRATLHPVERLILPQGY
jgi:hypothetical protein